MPTNLKLKTVDGAAPLTPDPPYELRITANKGYGLFATRDIKRGERVITEESLLTVPPGFNIQDLPQYLENLSPEQYAQYTDLASDERLVKPELRTHIQKTLGSKYTGPSLDATVKDSVKMHAIYLTNNVELGPSGIHGDAILPLYSRLNHFCARNINNTYNPTLQKETLHAIRDIAAGEELTTSYLSLSSMISADRQEVLMRSWGFECRCEACSGGDGARREKMVRLAKGIEAYEDERVWVRLYAQFPVPGSDAEVMEWKEEWVKLLKEEGLVGVELTFAYRSCSKTAMKLGQAAKAMAYARKELEIERICLGEEDAHREEGLVGARFWIKHLEQMNEQEAVKDRMNLKREAKELKKADKKAAKKAARG